MNEHNPAGTSDEPAEKAAKPIVVGIGASAGGVQTLQRFFQSLPDMPGAAFVVVIHPRPATPKRNGQHSFPTDLDASYRSRYAAANAGKPRLRDFSGPALAHYRP